MHLQNPVVLVAAAALILLLLLFLLIRLRRKRRRRAELAASRREEQFAAACQQIRPSDNSREIARQINDLFNQFLQMQLVALYAGRGDTLINILPSESSLLESLPSTVLDQYQHPQLASMTAFIVGREGKQLTEAAPSDKRDASISESDQVAVMPWRGAFGWRGLIIGRPQAAVASSLSRYEEAIKQLGRALSSALELERERSSLALLQQQTMRSLEFARSLAAGLSDPNQLKTIARRVAELLDASSAALWRMEAASGMVRMIACYGLRSSEFLPIPVGQGITGRVAQSGQVIALEDATRDPRCLFPRECRESGIVAYLGAPAVAAGQIVGVVEVYLPQPHRWSEQDQALLSSAAAAIAEVMKSADRGGLRLKVESAYLGLSEAFEQLGSRDEVMEAAVEVLGHALDVSRAMIVEFDEPGQVPSIKHEHVEQGVQWAVGADLEPGFAERVLEAAISGKPIATSDSRKQSLLSEEARERLQVLSEMVVPIKLDTGVRAFIYLHQVDRTRDWQADEIQFAERVARQVSLSIAKLEAREAAQRAARENLLARQIADSLPEAVIGLDREGRLIFFNQAARQQFQLKDEDLGRMAEMTEPLAGFSESLWEKVNTAKAVSRFEIQAKCYTPLPARSQAQPPEPAVRFGALIAPIYNDQGEIIGRILMLSDISYLSAASSEYERKLGELEHRLSQVQLLATQASAIAERAQAVEAELRKQLDQLRQDEARARASAQQLLEVNRLKSEFIVDTGLELESSLQSVLSFAESLERGSYGQLTPEQLEAVKQLAAWAQQVRAKTDALIEYGRTLSVTHCRSRQLEAKVEK
jgi:GAF domain-containing protein